VSAPENEPADERTAWSVGRVMRWLFIALPIAWLVRRIDLDAVAHAARSIGVAAFLAGLGTQFVSIGLATWRWRILLSAFSSDESRLPRYPSLLSSTFVGLYYALLPSGLVGDLVRAKRLESALDTAADSYAVMVVDRLCGVIGLLVLVAGVFVWSSSAPSGDSSGPIAVGALATATVIAAAVIGWPHLRSKDPRVAAMSQKIPVVGRFLARLSPMQRPSSLVVAIAISVAMQVVCAATIVCVVLPLATSDAIPVVAARAPLILLATLLPITPGALGQREVAFVAILGTASIDANAATAASLGTTFLSVVLAAIGGVLVLAEASARRG